ncbi:hypothetical protein [Sphingopyxis lindanitolerans]|nr:hypothetical protein [Sphingopyxis lindanitolerans]
MTVMKDPAMANEPQPRRRGPGVLAPIAILFAAAMLAGGFAGYNQAAVEAGNAALAPWVGPLVAFLFGAGALTLYFRRHVDTWRSWSPRKRLYWVSLAFSFALGIVIAVLMQAGQMNGAAEIFSNAALSPTTGLLLAALWVGGLGIAMVFYHRSIDDHERYAYQLGAVAGFYAFVIPCPVWWVLWRADIAPPIDAMALFVLALTVNLAVYLWFKFR